MVDVKHLNRVKGILSAKQGAEIPKFQNPAGPITYTVRSGDTLSQIVASYNKQNNTKLKWQDVASWNKIVNPNQIQVGQTIKFEDPAIGSTAEIPGDPKLTPTSAVESAAKAQAETGQAQAQTEAVQAGVAAAQESTGQATPVTTTLNGSPGAAYALSVTPGELIKSEGFNLAQEEKKKKLDKKEKWKKVGEAAGAASAAAISGVGQAFAAKQQTTDFELTKTVDTVYDGIADVASNMGPWGQAVGAIMGIAKGAGDIIQELGGGTDQQTKMDKWMDSAFFSWNIGMLNGFAGKNTQDFGVDYGTLAQVGSSYGGTVDTVTDAADKAGKKYGLFSTKARKKADAAINKARAKQNLMGDIADAASDQRLAVQSMGEQAGIAYSIMTDGGYNQKYTYAAKYGGSLEWNPIIEVEWEPQIELNWELPEFKEGGNINIKKELERFSELPSGNKINLDEVRNYYKDYDLSNVEFITDESPRTEGNKLFISNTEDAVHELWHYLSNNQPNEIYKDYYDNLTDDRIIELGGDLEFVKRFENDPGHFYHPSELEARIKAAKFKTQGQTYNTEFFQDLRNDENKYGNNMRDLLHMYNDANLVKIFNLKKGGKIRSIEELIEYAKQKNPRFIQRLSEEPRGIKFTDDEGKEAEGSHLLGYELNENGDAIVFPYIQEMENGELKLLSTWDAYDRAIENNNYLKMTPEEAKLFTESGEDAEGNLFGYKIGWPEFFKKFKKGGSLGDSDVPEIEETTQKNVIPEGALHKNKHHMEHAEGLTKKGIPVIDDDGDQQAEIEHSEIIFILEVTKKLEEYYEIFYSDETTNKEKEQAALEAGKLLVYQILENTEDRTGLIESCKKGGSLTLKKSADDLIEEVLEWMPTIVIIEEKEENKSKKDTKEKSEKEKMKEAIKEVLIDLLTS